MTKHNFSFDQPITGGLVLGHDGSEQADRALHWAVQEGRVHGYELHVVRAWVLSTAIRDTGVPFGTIPQSRSASTGSTPSSPRRSAPSTPAT